MCGCIVCVTVCECTCVVEGGEGEHANVHSASCIGPPTLPNPCSCTHPHTTRYACTCRARTAGEAASKVRQCSATHELGSPLLTTSASLRISFNACCCCCCCDGGGGCGGCIRWRCCPPCCCGCPCLGCSCCCWVGCVGSGMVARMASCAMSVACWKERAERNTLRSKGKHGHGRAWHEVQECMLAHLGKVGLA